jgi:hypothetical protein
LYSIYRERPFVGQYPHQFANIAAAKAAIYPAGTHFDPKKNVPILSGCLK